MDLGELVFNLNMRTEGLMAGVQTAMDRMGQLVDRINVAAYLALV